VGGGRRGGGFGRRGGDAATAATAAADYAPSRAFYSGRDGVRHDRGGVRHDRGGAPLVWRGQRGRRRHHVGRLGLRPRAPAPRLHPVRSTADPSGSRGAAPDGPGVLDGLAALVAQELAAGTDLPDHLLPSARPPAPGSAVGSTRTDPATGKTVRVAYASDDRNDLTATRGTAAFGDDAAIPARRRSAPAVPDAREKCAALINEMSRNSACGMGATPGSAWGCVRIRSRGCWRGRTCTGGAERSCSRAARGCWWGRSRSGDSLARFNLSFREQYAIRWVHTGELLKGPPVQGEEDPEREERESLGWPALPQEHTRAFLASMPDDASRAVFLRRRADRFARKLVRHTAAEVRAAVTAHGGVDSLVIASKYDPTSTTLALLPFLAPSGSFVVYCEYIEPLLELFRALQDGRLAIKLQLADTWTREYQVLEGRKHPKMNMSQSVGFLLSGNKLEPPPATRHRPGGGERGDTARGKERDGRQ